MSYASDYYGGYSVEVLFNALSGLTPFFNIQAQKIPNFNGLILNNVFNNSKWNFNISGIGTSGTNFYFTIKSNPLQEDSQSILQINNSGVIFVNGQYIGQPSGNLEYSTNNNGTINISVEPQVTTSIPEGTYVWDIKNTGNNVQIRSYGNIKIDTPVTKSF